MASKKPQFTNNEKGYTTPYLNAKKLSGKGDSAVYETADECMNRTKEIFNIEDVDCFWDEENKRYVAGPMPETKAEAPEANDELPETPEETMANAEEAKVDDQSSLPPVEDEEELDAGEDTETLKKSSDVKPTTADSDFDKSEPSEEPLPSVDGERMYDLTQSRGLQPLKTLFNKWGWEQGEDALIDKIIEEHDEFLKGERTKADVSKNVSGQTVTVIGTSSISECITNALVHFKYAHEFHGIDPVMMARLMHLRHQEQYDRYHS